MEDTTYMTEVYSGRTLELLNIFMDIRNPTVVLASTPMKPSMMDLNSARLALLVKKNTFSIRQYTAGTPVGEPISKYSCVDKSTAKANAAAAKEAETLLAEASDPLAKPLFKARILRNVLAANHPYQMYRNGIDGGLFGKKMPASMKEQFYEQLNASKDELKEELGIISMLVSMLQWMTVEGTDKVEIDVTSELCRINVSPYSEVKLNEQTATTVVSMEELDAFKEFIKLITNRSMSLTSKYVKEYIEKFGKSWFDTFKGEPNTNPIDLTYYDVLPSEADSRAMKMLTEDGCIDEPIVLKTA